VPHVGSRVKRPDDPRILTGRGRYVDDVILPRMVRVAFVRSVHAHARLARVDVGALVPFGAMLTEQPMTPQRVLRALGRLPLA